MSELWSLSHDRFDETLAAVRDDLERWWKEHGVSSGVGTVARATQMSDLPEELRQKVMDAIPAEQQRIIERQYAELVLLRDTLATVRETMQEAIRYLDEDAPATAKVTLTIALKADTGLRVEDRPYRGDTDE